MLKKNPEGFIVLRRELDFSQWAYWEGHNKRRVGHAVLEILLKMAYSIRLWERVLVFWSGVRREAIKGSTIQDGSIGQGWFFWDWLKKQIEINSSNIKADNSEEINSLYLVHHLFYKN